MKKITLYVFSSLAILSKSIAQVSISNPAEPPAPSAMLDVKSTNKGVLLPRVALSSAVDVSSIAAPATALIVYNTATAGTGTNAVTPGYYAWEGSRWNRLSNYADAVYESKTNNTSLATLVTGCTNDGPGLSSLNTNIAIPDANLAGITDTINFTGYTETVCNAQVDIRIDHPYVADLYIYLIAPDGTIVDLSTANGGDGDNYGTGAFPGPYIYTSFVGKPAFPSITTGTAPFAAFYQPEGSFASLNGKPINGKWVLKVVDAAGGDVGVILRWLLTLHTPANVNYVLEKEIPVVIKPGMSYLALGNYTAGCRDLAGIETHIAWNTVSAGPAGTQLASLPVNIQHSAAASPVASATDRYVNLHNQALLNGPVAGSTIYVQLWRRGAVFDGSNRINSSLVVQSFQQ
jgi:subtilisin-like proprotein convertase family protein